MKSILSTWWCWFRHGLKILLGGFAAYAVVAILFGVTQLLADSGQPILRGAAAFGMLILIPVSIAWFGYLFTRLYSYSTWCHDAVAELKKKEPKSALGNMKKKAEQDTAPNR